MRTIEIDELVYQYIQSRAIPFEEKTPNDTLLRLFGLTSARETPEHSEEKNSAQLIQQLLNEVPSTRKRAPAADLTKLVQAGLVDRNETLSLLDYQGDILEKNVASIMGRELLYKGETVSMSKLAEILLKQHGFSSNSVRGPAHWATSDGKTINNLWEKYLVQLVDKGATSEI